MQPDTAVEQFGALAQETRLNVLRRLVKVGPDGENAGQLAEATNVPASTLSFHLKELSSAGLVTSERNGRQIQYRANFDSLRELIRFLTEDCCQNNPAICMPARAELSC